MRCSKCLAPSDVVDTRQVNGIFVRRRRECHNGHRFTTYEVCSRCLNAREVHRALLAAQRSAKLYAKQRAALKQPGVPASVLAKKLGVNVATIYRWRKSAAKVHATRV